MSKTTKSTRTHAICKFCKKSRPLERLNGFDPVSGDYSQAHCRSLNDCPSEHSAQLIRKLGIVFPLDDAWDGSHL